MTQSFPFRDSDSELVPEAVLPRPNMMPPWKQSDVNASFTLDVLEKSGQKRRRSFGHQQHQQDQQFHHVYSNENHSITPNERVSTGTDYPYPGPDFTFKLLVPTYSLIDGIGIKGLHNNNNYENRLPHTVLPIMTPHVMADSVQLGNFQEPYPGGTNLFSGLESPAPASFPSERGGFHSRILESSNCGIFPFRAAEVVEQPAAASVLLARNHVADLFGARNHQRNLETAEAATAQAMANFQALIDQERSSGSGFHAYSGSNASQASTLPVLHRQNPSFTLLRSQQQLHQQQQLQYQQQQLQHQLFQQQQYHHQQQQEELHSNRGFSLNSSFELPTTTSSEFNYFSGFQDANSTAPLAFGPPAATRGGVANGSYEAKGTYAEDNAEPAAWPPTLTCNTSSLRNGIQSSTLFHDPPSPCTPRAHSVLLSDAQEEYLQHMERLNSEAHLSTGDSPPPRGGRRLSYNPSPVASDHGRISQENSHHNSSLNYNIFHPFELDHPGHENSKHLHVYFDDSGMPQRVTGVEDSAAPPKTTALTQQQLDAECAAAVSDTRGIAVVDEQNFASQQQQEMENFSTRLDEPAAPVIVVAAAGGEKEINRDNTDQFDLNEVPAITVGDAAVTPPTTKPRKKYHPRVAKDKRTYKRRVDGKKGPAAATATPGGDGGDNTDSPAKKSTKKRPTMQFDFTHEEGRDSSYPEVVDMDIEDMTTPGVGTQHDTAVCDCEACIKARLERRSATALAPKSRFTLNNSFDDTPQKAPGSRHSPDSSSNSPSVRRTLFQARQGAAARRLPSAFDDSSSKQANTVVISQENSTVRRLPSAFDDSSSEQANTVVISQENSTVRRLPSAFDDSSSEQANTVVISQENSTVRRLPSTFDDSSSEQANTAVILQENSIVRRLPSAFDDSSSEQANTAVLTQAGNPIEPARLPLNFDDSSPVQAHSTAGRLPLGFDDSSPKESNAAMLSLANSRLSLDFEDLSSNEATNAVGVSQANSTAFENVRSFFNESSSQSTCLQQFTESATQLGFSWAGRHLEQEGDAAKSFDWNSPELGPPSSTTTSSSFLSRLCPRGLLSSQKTPFRDMSPIQRVVYLKSILSANPQLTMSPKSLLRHVHDHLPEEEKQEFQDSLWPVILKPLTEEQMKQLQEFANEERLQMVDGTPRLKRKPGPKPKKELLAMTLFPNLMPPAPTKKPGKPRKTPKKNSAEDFLAENQQRLQIVPYDDDNNNNNNREKEKNEDTAMVPYESRTEHLNGDTAMVPYANQTSVIPYEGPIRKKKARPKVVLDGETVRVWKLLMGKPATTGEEPASDEENERKWAEERRKMKAQALLFIDRMHVVQGDRSFSCWKGSVVDSVVGAFLTQNVNDVLSSSAFMSMRSRFPGRGFRRPPLQTQSPEDDTMAQSFESPRAPAPTSQTSFEPSPQHHLTPQFPTTTTTVTLLESQESRNREESSSAHLPKEDTAAAAPQPPVHTISWTPQTHEDSTASTTISEVINPPEDPSSNLPRHELSGAFTGTISQVFNQPEPELSSTLPHSTRAASIGISEVTNPPEDMTSSLPLSRLSVSTISEVINPPAQERIQTSTSRPRLNKLPVDDSTISEVTNPHESLFDTTSIVVTVPVPENSNNLTCHSENSSGLDFQTLPGGGSSTTLVNGNVDVDVVVSSAVPSTSTTSAGSGALVESVHDASHGKYNPKTGLTGLERAKIEEKQVTARKSFDFSALNEEFKPRGAGGEHRAPAPPRTEMTEDGVDWEAVRAANVQEVADVIKERGLNWILAGRIKAFLERIHLDYGALDLEWLRSMSTDQTKEFLLSIRGLGLKSVECIRLLTLHHLAFPVDTNVGRICVRLGWVPLEPLPEELQLHLLELYPVQATIQKYLWPRLCKLDQQTLYELHYQLITFGKVFCTKSKPNCNACPMRPECKHFASALSSAKLALPASERPNNGPTLALPPGTEPLLQQEQELAPSSEPPPGSSSRPVSQYCQPIVEEPMTPESEADLEEFDIEDYPFSVEEVEVDGTDSNLCIQDYSQAPTPTPTQFVLQSDTINNPNCSSILSITDHPSAFVTVSEPDMEPELELEAPAVSNSGGSGSGPMLTTIMEDWGGLATSVASGRTSGATTTVCEEANCCQSSSVIKIVESVCEESEVLDLESHVVNTTTTNSTRPCEVLIHTNPALSSHEMVLVAPGAASLPVPKLKNVGRLRTVHYVYELPDNHPLLDGLDPREHDDPCTYLLAIWSPGEVPESIPNMNNSIDEENPFAASSSDGEESIKATLLVPCRTAMQGSFPLNGTYFQVNEVFADHASSLQPMIVPRTLLWNLRRRFVFFGTSVTSIFRGMTVEEIQACFWRGYVCVRGFDRATRAPKPLVRRLHLQSGRSSAKEANMEN